MKHLFFVVAALFSIALISVRSTQGASNNSRPSHGAWGVDLTDRDPSVKPGDNFYMSQNGGWFNGTES